MYLHHPQFNKILEIISNNEIGEIYKLEYKLGFDIRKKFLAFKKKIKFLSRLTDPILGGGAINDIGCYPISFSNKLANFNKKNDIEKIHSKGTIGFTGVDEYSKISITYMNNSFSSDITVSINKKQDGLAIISGTKGKIVIPNLITPKKNYSLLVNEKEYNFLGNDLYTYIIKDTQDYINNGVCEPNKKGLNWNEMKLNCELIDLWKSQIYKSI
jgi:predicted dehydrogenase